jgi:NAD-dependent DNA ligase
LCSGKKYFKFIHGFNQLGVDGSGGAAIKKLWDAGFTRAIDILDKKKFNKENLIKSGEFKDGKTLDKLIQQVYGITQLPLKKLLLMIAFDGMGSKTSEEVARKIANQKHNFAGLEKRVVEGFDIGGPKRKIALEAIELLQKNGVEIILPEVFDEQDITYEMTGSPSSFGFKTKKDFVEYAKSKGYRHTGLKDAKILFTDDITSNSGKMKDAQKRGVIAKLYSEI